jgi:hypothetical protein
MQVMAHTATVSAPSAPDPVTAETAWLVWAKAHDLAAYAQARAHLLVYGRWPWRAAGA